MRLVNAFVVIYYYYYYFAHHHKAAGVKTKQNVKQRLQTASYSVIIVLRKETASPAAELWTGVETGRLFLWCPGLWCVCQSPGLDR